MATEFYNRNWRMPKSSNSNKVSNYSMSFEGVNNYLNIGSDIDFAGKNFSISGWYKITKSSGNSSMFSMGASKNIGIWYDGTNVNFYNQTSSWNGITASMSKDVWHNVVCIYDGSNRYIYIDGTLANSGAKTGSQADDGTDQFIGYLIGISSFDYEGKIDHVAIFDYALTDGTGGTVNQIGQLYGNSTDGVGNPLSLSTKPVAYYKIGDKAAFNGSEYLVTNSASEVYSPYALDFDGTNDYIDLGGDSSLFPTSQLTASIWLKASTQSNFRYVMAAPNSTSYPAYGFSTRTIGSTQGLQFVLNTGSAILSPLADVLDNTWHHIASTYDGSSLKMFVDGSEVGTGTSTSGIIIYGTGAGAGAGKLLLGDFGAFSLFFSGSLSNCSIWNAALTSTQVTELYNEGKPSNLNNHSAYSNLVSWWQLGENSSFDGTNWTVLDEKGTNNGTSANMTEADLVNGVGTTGNGLSSGMGGADNIIGDAPYSTANAVSYGMGVDALSTDVPS